MRIVQTVFGVFHQFALARELEARGHLQCVFSSWPRARLAREGVPANKIKTFPWIHAPEYVMRKLGILPQWLEDQTGYLNALAFDEYTLRKVISCDALIAISGSSLRTGKKVQRQGGVFVCDRGSSHQRFQEGLISDEYRRWGVDQRVGDLRDTVREEAIYEQADAIVVPSTFAAKSFLEMGVSADKVYTIPYGVLLTDFQHVADPPTDRFEVLFVGSVGLRKGVPYLIEAFARLEVGRKRLRIVGDLGREMTAVLRRLPMEDVELVGSVPQTHLPAIMGSSHVMVLPSIEDGFGMVIGQAMASGCPVLVSENTGGPDMITDGSDGFIVPIRDATALRDRMQQIADDSDLRERLRDAGMERVKDIGGWRNYGDRWERLLLDLTQRT